MGRLVDYLKILFQTRYIYSLQKFDPIKENGLYILKEFGTHTCIKVSAEDIFESDLLYNIHPIDIVYITRYEEFDIREKQKLKIIEERRDFSFVLQNAYSRKEINGKDILIDETIVKKIDPMSIVRIAYMSGLKDGRKISDNISKTERIKSNKSAILKVIK